MMAVLACNSLCTREEEDAAGMATLGRGNQGTLNSHYLCRWRGRGAVKSRSFDPKNADGKWGGSVPVDGQGKHVFDVKQRVIIGRRTQDSVLISVMFCKGCRDRRSRVSVNHGLSCSPILSEGRKGNEMSTRKEMEEKGLGMMKGSKGTS